MVSREQFLAVERLTETVEVPGLGTVTVRELTQDEYAEWVEQWLSRENGEPKADRRRYVAALLQATVVNGNGEPMFTAEDVATLTQRPARIIRPLVAAAERLNPLEVPGVRDAKKNSERGQDG